MTFVLLIWNVSFVKFVSAVVDTLFAAFAAGIVVACLLSRYRLFFKFTCLLYFFFDFLKKFLLNPWNSFSGKLLLPQIGFMINETQFPFFVDFFSDATFSSKSFCQRLTVIPVLICAQYKFFRWVTCLFLLAPIKLFFEMDYIRFFFNSVFVSPRRSTIRVNHFRPLPVALRSTSHLPRKRFSVPTLVRFFWCCWELWFENRASLSTV